MHTPHPRAIKFWLYCIAALVLAMVLVGGATRLTGSGLSITEWKPIMGAIPPLTHVHWLEAFEKYKAIPQYQLVNKGMSLVEFQYIFWWEWAHRFLGRVVGLVFFVPFIIFWRRGWLSKPLRNRCLILLALGGAQGFMGWYMVQSGLVERVSVSHFRLAAHLTLASFIFALTLWTIWTINRSAARVSKLSIAIIALIFLQIVWGAFVAGSHAGLIYNTWPLMDGALIPSSLWERDFWHDHMPLQFVHRCLAYGLFTVIAVQAWRSRTRISLLLLGAICVQIAIGILTLLTHVQLHAALTHQIMGMVVLAIAVRAALPYTHAHEH